MRHYESQILDEPPKTVKAQGVKGRIPELWEGQVAYRIVDALV